MSARKRRASGPAEASPTPVTPAGPGLLRDVAIVVAVALVFRALSWVFLARTPFFAVPVVDAATFDAWARAIVAGEAFQSGAYFKPPLYPYLLSVLYRVFGTGAAAVAAVQMLAGAASCALVYVIGRRVFGRGVAAGGALIIACLPMLPFFESQRLAEPWTLLLTLAALERLLPPAGGAVGRPGAGRLAAAGLMLGVAALGRPNLMLLIVAIAVWAGVVAGGTSARRIGLAALVVAAAAAAILPTTVRNWRAEGTPVLISANAGVNLYTGHRDGADGVSAIPVGLRWQALQRRCEAEGHGGVAASSRFLGAVAFDWMRAHPDRTLELLGRKLLALVSGVEARNNVGATWLAREHGVATLARWWPGVWLMLPFAFVGLVFVRRRPGSGLLITALAVQAAAVLPFFVNARFRQPLLPLAALFASVGAVLLWRRLRAGGRAFLAPALVLVAGFALVNVDWLGLGDPARGAEDAYNEGLILHGKLGDAAPDPVAAQALYARAAELDPEFPDPLFGAGLARLEQAEGEMGTARRDLQAGRTHTLPSIARTVEAMLVAAAADFHGAAAMTPGSARLVQVLGKVDLTGGQLAAFQAAGSVLRGDDEATATHLAAARSRYAAARRRLDEARRLDAGLAGTADLLRALDESERSLRRFSAGGGAR